MSLHQTLFEVVGLLVPELFRSDGSYTGPDDVASLCLLIRKNISRLCDFTYYPTLLDEVAKVLKLTNLPTDYDEKCEVVSGYLTEICLNQGSSEQLSKLWKAPTEQEQTPVCNSAIEKLELYNRSILGQPNYTVSTLYTFLYSTNGYLRMIYSSLEKTLSQAELYHYLDVVNKVLASSNIILQTIPISDEDSTWLRKLYRNQDVSPRLIKETWRNEIYLSDTEIAYILYLHNEFLHGVVNIYDYFVC
jgi:hypothetical protein